MNTNGSDPSNILDMQVIQGLRELGGDDDPGLLVELVGIFLQDAPQRMQDISESLATGDVKRLERAAHTLKSSSANVGAMTLSACCKEMEELARQKSTGGIAEIFARTQSCFGGVEAALRALCSG